LVGSFIGSPEERHTIHGPIRRAYECSFAPSSTHPGGDLSGEEVDDGLCEAGVGDRPDVISGEDPQRRARDRVGESPGELLAKALMLVE
jgi:hypothetical protein